MKVKNTVTRNHHSLRRIRTKYRYYSLTVPVFSSDAAQAQEVWCEEDRKSNNRIFQLKTEKYRGRTSWSMWLL